MASWNQKQWQQDMAESPRRAGLSSHSSFLDDRAVGFTHVKTPAVDRGLFRLTGTQDGTQAGRGGSRVVALPAGRYQRPPQLAKGLKACHLNHENRDRDNVRAIDLELDVITHPRNTSAMLPVIQARNSGCSTKLIYDAEMTWMEAKQGAKDCMILTTRWDLTSGESKKKIAFPRAFEGELEVLCWIKDFRFRTWCDTASYTLDVKASNVTATGFTAVAKGSRNTQRLTTTWIIHRKGKPKVASGTFRTLGDGPASNTGRIAFPRGAFIRKPTVLVALSGFDLAGDGDLSIGTYATSVSPGGFDWHLNTGADDSREALRSAEGTYIALGFV
ncbi:hypothetical protein DOTSEDRAFT_22724 [Dothistroma septosporum NZE10]|uniref:H-type lectin domain-containing protein n=1 Tax=Dothistroma septosporum (strain NZE10 / CBS 128990) TaxID=675120 RepID=N1PWD7_DOTSN|nr:hypothetical protein DOTSEDRAFT_22724 [Dothistroma septosporum NZE10]